MKLPSLLRACVSAFVQGTPTSAVMAKPVLRRPRTLLVALALTVAGACALQQAAHAQLYVAGIYGGTISTYDPVTGMPIHAPLVSSLADPVRLVLAEDRLFVASSEGVVGVYNATTGAAINASFISGLPLYSAGAMALSGDTLYLSTPSGVETYNATTGVALNPGFSAVGARSLAIAPGGLLIADPYTRVGLYDATTGAPLAGFVPFFAANFPTGMAVAGNNLYVMNSNGVGLYDATTGAVINAKFITDLSFGWEVVESGGRLYVSDVARQTVRVYDSQTGELINPSLVEGDAYYGMALGQPTDQRPQFSAQGSGLAFGNASSQSVLGSVQSMLGDINGHLFGLRAGGGDEDADSDNGGLAASLDEGVIVGQGDGPEGGKNPVARRVARSSQWEVFTTVNFANVSLSAIGSQPGVDSYTWAPGVGVEKRVAPGLILGFAANLLEAHQTYGNGLGTQTMEGFGLSTYASYVKRDYWIDLLYSFGRFDLESERNPGFAFPVARGETTAYTNAVQLNGGWKFHVPAWQLTHGPFAGVDYLNVKIGDYNEAGGGAAALTYASRSIDSLITRVGYSVSKRIDTNFATITPQLRVSYERQNISNNNGTSVNLINQAFTASTNAQSPGQDYLVAGAGVNFEFSPTLSLMLNYQGQFFRSDLQAHYAGVRLGWKF